MVQAIPLGDRVRELLGGDRALLEQDPLRRDAGRARVLDRLLRALAIGEAELDDDVGEEPAGAATPPRRRDPDGALGTTGSAGSTARRCGAGSIIDPVRRPASARPAQDAR